MHCAFIELFPVSQMHNSCIDLHTCKRNLAPVGIGYKNPPMLQYHLFELVHDFSLSLRSRLEGCWEKLRILKEKEEWGREEEEEEEGRRRRMRVRWTGVNREQDDDYLFYTVGQFLCNEWENEWQKINNADMGNASAIILVSVCLSLSLSVGGYQAQRSSEHEHRCFQASPQVCGPASLHPYPYPLHLYPYPLHPHLYPQVIERFCRWRAAVGFGWPQSRWS